MKFQRPSSLRCTSGPGGAFTKKTVAKMISCPKATPSKTAAAVCAVAQLYPKNILALGRLLA